MNSSLGVQSKEEQERALQQCSDHEDLFSVYVRTIISNAPLFYVFINITLLIWIAQTVFSSKINAIPNSLYLLSPFFSASPFSELIITQENNSCPFSTSSVPLKTFPTIYSNHIFHRQLFNWGESPIKFCVKKIPLSNQKTTCQQHEVLCSGYCVQSSNDCPITKISITHNQSKLIGFEDIYQSSSDGRHYKISRAEGVPIVGIAVSYQPKCANDQYFNTAFNNQTQFWSQVKDCKEEGKITTIFNEMDAMQTNAFFQINNISITTTDPTLQQVYLGTVNQFHLADNDNCKNVLGQMQKIKQYLSNSPTTPQFTQSLLIISFILLIGELVWLACYYCFDGLYTQKNIVAAMFSIIELVIIGFIYNENLELFRIQKLSQIMAQCFQQSIPAFKNWSFGMSSPEVFQMVLFVNTAFLGLYFSSLFFDYFVFEEYKRVITHLPRLQKNNHI